MNKGLLSTVLAAPGLKPFGVAVAAASIATATGFGVYAALNATANNPTPQSVGSGTLRLLLSNVGNGFSQNITGLAPGDVVNRYVTLNNGGTLDAQGLTMSVAATGSSTLITDGTSPATLALRVSVSSCTVAWDATTGACGGTVTNLVANASLSSLATPVTVLSSATALPVGANSHLRVAVTLPDQTETTTNGTAPATTIQGQSADLTFTFTTAQRTAATTNS